eukprot:Gregarina_sp_Pseudo_9__625@NODE_13_length_6388_cov_18_254528_g11_i0_p4_GENE_NODE_13_length_6388_cov_18_254528_g11_i0NODE_13_length_6388_cov_18_254528_g11_i0_p4_ORF_typecomplete_len242_score33_94Ala_racemase_N/PF01168_20/4_1e45CDK2AP/PF09806_9/4_5e03CDK2AP/PF09806_9/0_67JAKMIP_CC3/PF16034_5/4_3e02JAKMIP_CC3/PF16034_5/0_75_NODE_13_length_6388_cov_18_254528_g11_i030113736
MEEKEIEQNYHRIKQAIEAVEKERTINEHRPVDLVVVSKLKPVESIKFVHKVLGHTVFGENYVQEVAHKVEYGDLPDGIRFTFIGHLQRNKVKHLILKTKGRLERIETVDSVELGRKIQSVCQGCDVTLDIMVQVNTSREPAKSGLMEYGDIKEVCRCVLLECPNLKLIGLMTIANQELGTEFAELRQTAERLRREFIEAREMEESAEPFRLSMGMSGDFREAIMSGSTEIRVGTAILGSR